MIDLPIFSPVEQILHPQLQQKELSLYMKRDDLIHPMISGNKWRKLKHLLQKAVKESRNHLVTFGGVWSNHLLATACAAAKFGFKSTGLVRGEETDSDVLFLCRMLGMRLMFIGREEYRDKHALFQSSFAADPFAMFIEEGGASAEAALGCSELVDELEYNYDHIFCASGTGTTAAGIINGLVQKGYTTRFHAVPVLKGGDFMRNEIGKWLLWRQDYDLHTDYHFGGYAKTTPELLQFIKDFSSATGILLDPVYTGKMMCAVFDLAAKDYFPKGASILCIHTGGLFGLLGMKDRFSW